MYTSIMLAVILIFFSVAEFDSAILFLLGEILEFLFSRLEIGARIALCGQL